MGPRLHGAGRNRIGRLAIRRWLGRCWRAGLLLLKRLVLPLLLLSFLTFGLLRVAGGDVVEQRQGLGTFLMSEEEQSRRRSELGLDRPWLQQYGSWLWRFLQGDWGRSLVSGQEIRPLLMLRFAHSALLALLALGLALVLALPLGILGACFRGTCWDRLGHALCLLLASLPGFLLALILIQIFSLELGLLPVLSASRGISGPGLVLPVLTLALSLLPKFALQIRAATIEEVQRSWHGGSLARGWSARSLLLRQVCPAVLARVLPLLGLSLGGLLGGSVIVETIFMWDGLGHWALDALGQRDYPVILAYLLLMAVIYLTCSLAVDLICQRLDPRMQRRRRWI